MNLLETLEHARGAIRSLRHREPEPWEIDDGEFLAHFGVPVEELAERVALLSEEQGRLLTATIDVNPEAAVLWVLAMEPEG